MNIKNDPAINSFLQRMPEKVQKTFTDEQLMHLKVAIGARQWGKHKVDFRFVLSFFSYRYYIVFLSGRNRRDLSVGEQRVSIYFQALFVALVALFSSCIFLLVIYMFKSALGIDIFDDYSSGVWSWFKELFK
ncbi:3-phosphoshikimate 1-carboxyvinyltransferase [Pseudoalteromonas distincta]|uniref:3-phosphoshikimate 1-carboxyvinyltransferase n=1 Tax=Pseudoalteromonas distincta TaxID=77608 RepID=UPI003218DCE9